MSVLPSPIYFPEINNVTTCEPYEFTFAYVSTSPTFTSNVSENTLTAYVQWIIGDDPGVMEYTLVNNATLYPSFTSLIWSPVDAGPGAYVIKGNVYSDAGIVYEETSRFFSIEAGTDESCITQTVDPTTTAANDVVPTSTSIESAPATEKSKLSDGAIAGIVIGIVAVKLIALLVAIILMRRRRAAALKSQARSSIRMAPIPPPSVPMPMTKEEEKEREAYMWSDTASLRSIPPPYGHA